MIELLSRLMVQSEKKYGKVSSKDQNMSFRQTRIQIKQEEEG